MSRIVSRGGSAKPSFHTAASQARESQSGGGRKASFTITRPADGASRVVVTSGGGAGATSASASSASHAVRQVTLRGEGSSSISRSFDAPLSSTVRRLTIETSADSGRQVVRAGTKRRSGDMAASTGGGLALRRTVINEAAMDAEEEGDEYDDEPRRAQVSGSALKRGRFVIENTGATSRSSASAPFATGALSAPAPPLPGVQFSASLAAKVAQAAAERLAAAPPKTNAVMAVTPLPSAMPAAATLTRGPLQASSPASSPRPLTHVLLRNLSPSITSKFLLSHVFPLYDVQRIAIDRDPATGLCAGTGDAWFESDELAEEAVRMNQGQTFFMQQIRMSIIRDNEEPMMQQMGYAAAPAPPTAAAPVLQQPQQPRQPQQSPLSFRVPVGSTAPVATQSKPVSASFPSASATASAASPFAPVAPAPSSLSSSSSGAAAPTPSPLSHPLTNVGFVGVFGDPDAHMMDDEETVFNITNLRGAAHYSAAAAAPSPSPIPSASPHSHSASSVHTYASASSAAPRPKVVQLRPKSVVVSGAEAMAGVASSKTKPSFTLGRNATGSADGGWHQQQQQPKTVVLNPRR